jgi:hypothetical protein
MQADFSVELGPDDPVLELPWASGDPSVRYYDLKSSPELVLQIPEAIAYPELGAFLTRINASSSQFETAKCDVWQSREISAEEEIFEADQKFVSYIDLVFVDETMRGSFEKHEEFAKELCLLLGHAPDTLATIELIIRRCYFHRLCAGPQDERDQIANSMRSDLGFCDLPVKKEEMAATGDCRNDPPLRLDLEPSQRLTDDKRPKGDSNACLHNPNAFLRSNTCLNGADDGHANVDPSRENPSADSDANADINPNALISGFYFTVYVTGFGNREYEPRRQWEIAIALCQHALMQLSRG